MTQLVLDLPLRPAFGREDFLVAPCNAQAVAWIDCWPDWPDRVLVVHGPPGCGKSHLAAVWRNRSGAVPLRLPAQSELGTGAEAAPDRLPPGDIAHVIDDADRTLAERADTEFLLHLVNRVRAAGGWLLLTGTSPPARWPAVLPDLHSRLAAAHSVAVDLPDDALVSGLVVKLFADRQLAVGPDVVAYIATRAERSFDAIRQAVAAIDRAGLAAGRRVTVPLVRTILDR